jgi:hypothetical protein
VAMMFVKILTVYSPVLFPTDTSLPVAVIPVARYFGLRLLVAGLKLSSVDTWPK